MNRAVLTVFFVLFAALTAYAVHHVGGVWQLLHAHLSQPAGWQIFADLVIVMCLLLVFVYRDAKATGRPFVPWAMASLLLGSFGPLLYFITAKPRK